MSTLGRTNDVGARDEIGFPSPVGRQGAGGARRPVTPPNGGYDPLLNVEGVAGARSAGFVEKGNTRWDVATS